MREMSERVTACAQICGYLCFWIFVLQLFFFPLTQIGCSVRRTMGQAGFFAVEQVNVN